MRQTWQLGGRFFLVLSVMLLTQAGLDELLIRSDARSLSLLLSAALLGAAILCFFAAAVLQFFAHLLARRDWLTRLATVAPYAVCAAGCVAIVAQPVLRRFAKSWLVPWIYLSVLAVYWWFSRRDKPVGQGLNRLGTAGLLVALVVAPAWLGIQIVGERQHPHLPALDGQGRGLLVVVVDALGAEFLSGLNPDSPVQTPRLDDFLGKSLVFPNAHTNAPHTSGAFGALYSGRATPDSARPGQNLVAALQRHGVTVRIVASHLNAIPDSRGMRYRGLRSMLLTQNYTWLPRLLGVDYHIRTYLDAARMVNEPKGLRRPRLWYLRRFFNSPFPVTDPFDVTEDELNSLVGQGEKFLLLLHLFFNDTRGSLPKPGTIDLYAEHTDEEREAAAEAIRARSYRYTDQEAWYVEEYRAAYLDGVKEFDAAFGRFWEQLVSSGLAEEIDILLLADHGSTSKDQQVWYSYHSSEEVTRIPLALYQPGGAPQIVTRPCATVDVAATIRDFFGVDAAELPTEGSSLLAPLPDAMARCLVKRDNEGMARTVLYSTHRKDTFSVDANHGVRWLESKAIGPDGRVMEISVEPANPDSLATEVREYCLRHGCAH